MNNWISALAQLQQRGEPCVLVTIIEEQGSTPRNAGSKMVICADQIFDTIGGGHLEYKAMEIARQLLSSGKQDTHLQRFSLGASLGQCCGGVAVLLFEPMGKVQAQIAVFGAGHVARALVPLLASLPCRVRWIDSREQEFPSVMPPGVEKIVTDEPVDEVDTLPAGCYCIVMTHNHALDLAHRLEQQHRHPAATLAQAGAEAETLQMGRVLAAVEHLAGNFHCLVLQVTATDGIEDFISANHHL